METSFYKDSYAYHLATHLIYRANHKDNKMVFNGDEIIIKRGQVLTGRYKLAQETGIGISTIRRKLKLLQKIGFLTIKTTNKFSIVTIVKYSSYQEYKASGGQQVSHQETHQQDQQKTTNNNVKNVKNNNNILLGPKVPKGRIDKIRSKYITLKGYSHKDFTQDDYSRTGRAIKTLLTKADHKDHLVIEALGWVSGLGYTEWTLETIVKKWPDFLKYSKRPELLKKYGV